MSSIAPPRQLIIASSDERVALVELEAVLVVPAQAELSVVAADGRQVALPASAAGLIREIVRGLAQGFAVELAARPPELTAVEAAAFLHVPEFYLLGLIAEGTLTLITTDRGQFVCLEDIEAYQQRRAQQRREAMTKLVRMSEELGLYENDDAPGPPRLE